MLLTLQTTEQAALIVQSEDVSTIFVANIAQFLKALSDTYLTLSTIEAKVKLLSQGESIDLSHPEIIEMRILLTEARHLVLGRVSINSPGIWEFLGQLNPLTIIRQAILDYIEWLKDERYRNNAEALKLRLENLLLHAEVINKWVEALRNAVLSDAQIQMQIDKLTSPIIEMVLVGDWIEDIQVEAVQQ